MLSDRSRSVKLPHLVLLAPLISAAAANSPGHGRGVRCKFRKEQSTRALPGRRRERCGGDWNESHSWHRVSWRTTRREARRLRYAEVAERLSLRGILPQRCSSRSRQALVGQRRGASIAIQHVMHVAIARASCSESTNRMPVPRTCSTVGLAQRLCDRCAYQCPALYPYACCKAPRHVNVVCWSCAAAIVPGSPGASPIG